MKLLKNILFALSLSVCLSSCQSSCCYATENEKTYIVTETELTTLENNLNWQQNENKRLNEQLNGLNDELITLKTISQSQKEELKKANQLLTEYAQENKKKVLKIKRQRNLYYCLMIGLSVYAIRQTAK